MSPSPGYNIYQTQDGRYIALGIGRRQSWESLCKALHRADLVEHQWAVGEKRQEVLSFLRNVFKTRSREEWLGELRALDIEIGPVNTPLEAYSDPQVQYRHMVLEVNHPVKGQMRHPGIPIEFSETPGMVRRPVPLVGQDTEEVVKGLGYPREGIE